MCYSAANAAAAASSTAAGGQLRAAPAPALMTGGMLEALVLGASGASGIGGQGGPGSAVQAPPPIVMRTVIGTPLVITSSACDCRHAETAL